MIISSRYLTDLNRVLSRFCIVNAIAVIGILGGIIPEVSWKPSSFPFTPSAVSQVATPNFSQTQINNYAKAILAIEKERTVAYSKIQSIVGHMPPKIACNQKESLSTLPKEAQQIAVAFCNRAKKIAKESSLTSSDFNAITEAARTNPILKKRIQTVIIQLRSPKKP